MHYTNYQPTPVYSSDGKPTMPCHPARARKLLANGRAVPHHIKGIFGIRLLDRSRADCNVQDVGLNVDPGSDTTGFAVVTDDKTGQRTVLAAVELKHRAKAIKATMTSRASNRRNRRGRLRYRAPRFDNRRRKPGTLPPSVDSLRTDTMRVVNSHRFLWEDAGDVVDQPISSARASKTLCWRPTTDTSVGGSSRSRRSRSLSVSINAVGGSSPNASRMSIGVMTECCSGLVLVTVLNQALIRRQSNELGQS